MTNGSVNYVVYGRNNIKHKISNGWKKYEKSYLSHKSDPVKPKQINANLRNMHKIERFTEENESNCRDASLIAYHLVNLVLQEGCMIANAAIESGRPREYLSMRKNVRSDLTYVISPGDDAPYVDTAVDTYIEGPEHENTDPEINLLVTSTPQKLTDEKAKRENGQGDEDIEAQQNDLSNATSLFINNLFDISDVELGIYEDATLQNANHGEELGHLMNNVMDMYVSAALEAFHEVQDSENNDEFVEKCVTISEDSSLCYLEETLCKVDNDGVFYVDMDERTAHLYEIPQDPIQSEITIQQSDDIREDKTEENSELYENAYLTLNRDYNDDRCSEEEEFPILEDPKGMIMQEIALLTANTSHDTEPVSEESEKNRKKYKEDLAATSGLTASSRKSRLVQRCRQQGTKFLACLRGWWRRKATRKLKARESRLRGLGPLSPVARRRSLSLLHRPPPSPAPSRYKCSTINEALLNSSQWMDYTFETKSFDCGDV